MQLKKFLLFGLLAAVLPAFAEEAADRKTATSLKYVEHELDTRQNKFTAEQNKAMEYTNTAGDVQKRTVKSDLGSDTSDTSLPMVGGVNTKLATKQDDIAPINDHTAVTYTGTAGQIGAKGIYQDTGTYADQSDNLIDAKTFNAALKRGLDSEFLCSEYKPGTDLCWVWSIHNNGESRNLFDKTNNSWIFRNRSLAATMDGYWYYANGSTSLACPCEPNTTYTVSGFTDGGSIYRFATIDSAALPTTTDQTSIPYSFIHRETTNPGTYTFTTPATAKWIVVQTNSAIFDSTLNTIQIEKGSTATTYHPYQDVPYTTLVPAGYTPVEWIASNGNQWIDTGVTDSNRAVFTMSATAESSDMIEFIISNIDSSNYQYGFGLYHSNVAGFSRIDMTEKHNYNIIYSSTGISLVYDGEDKGSTTNYHVDDNKKIVLFGGDFASRRISAKLYNIRLYNNDEMVFDGIPAKQGNNVGLYDTVSHTFKQSLGTLAFTAGPDINNIIYVPQNQ